MNYEIIFYRSGQTAEIQQLTEKILEPLRFSITSACAASDKEELAGYLRTSLKKSRLIFAVGGIDDTMQSIEKLLTRILKPKGSKNSIDAQVITDKKSKAFYIKSAGQMIIILPDRTEDIENLKEQILRLAAKEFSLETDRTYSPDIEKIGNEINAAPSIIQRTRIFPYGSTAEKRNRSKLRTLKTIVIVLISLGILELAAAAALFFVFK